MKNQKMLKIIVIATVSLLLILITAIFFSGTTEKMSYNHFLHQVEQGTVDKVTLYTNGNTLTVTLQGESVKYEIMNPQTDTFVEYLLKNDVDVLYSTMDSNASLVRIVLLVGIAGGIGFFILNKRNNPLIKNSTTEIDIKNALMLDDIAGNIEAKYMVEDIIQFIKEPEKYERLNAKMPKGILFYGPPGTGKTMLAKAVATEAAVPFYAMSGSDFIQMYVGVGASRIRDLFKKAKKTEKAVIFIDEIDAIGKKRGKSPNASNDERDQTLNALLTEMSGFHERMGIVVIAATNRLDTLDEALTRPGRFDRLIEIGLPDINARKKILALHSRLKPLSEEVDLEELARSTVSFSGAMLENLLNEAAIFAANNSCEYIMLEHIDRAYYTIIAGSPKSDTSYITKEERQITAFHEAGHAYMTKLLLPDSYISKVTIIPSVQGAGGFSLSIPKESLFMTKQGLLANMKVLLAGRAAEELMLGKDNITTGASNDIEKVSQFMMDYINKYGMDDEFGIFNFLFVAPHTTNHLVDICRNKVNLLYEETLELLRIHFQTLEKIAISLVEKETLSDADIDLICTNEIE
jgi:ATP-dependent metalloprotease FtsH